MDYKKLVKQGYEQCAQNYLDERDLFKNQKYLEDLIIKLKKGSKILDIGCGAGVPIDKFLIKNDFDVTGIDISPKQIKLAQKNNPKGKFLVKDMSEINFPKNSFDAIISFYAIFHIKREDHQNLFNKLFSILKQNGFLLVTMGYEEWEGTEDFHGTKMFWSQYGVDKNLEIVKNSGFKIIHNEIDTSGGEKHLIIFAQK
jgi:cyclopropane fatty-acyl-phospholipid synthase-like methyltransferase